jgi:drug/metabolite transporter (DMT)-like permease
MDYLWIVIAVFAALMQAVRTAAQKTLNQTMSNLGTTYVRSLVGLPIMAVYLTIVLAWSGRGVPPITASYVGFTLAGAVSQVVATMLLIYMFKLRNFAVGTMLTKVDILMTAIIGALFFSETLSAAGVAALVVVVSGVILMSVGRMGLGALRTGHAGLLEILAERSTLVALACALMFTFSYLLFREATLIIKVRPGDFMWSAAWTVVIATIMQVLVMGPWLAVTEPKFYQALWSARRIAAFIGVTSSIGSVGWFTAFALQNASYVRAVGQIEVVFTLLIAWLYFRERIAALEYAGIVLVVCGVLSFRLMQT